MTPDDGVHETPCPFARDTVIDVLNSLFIGTDQHDWAKVRDCFAASVRFDKTSLVGGLD